MKILGTGLNGLVGSRIVELLKDSYEFENISRSIGVDITNKEQVDTAVSSSDAEIILHLAGKTDVDGCELDKKDGGNGEAYKTNVLGTQNIKEAAEKHKKKLIYISTDFVFDGEKEFYREEDVANPVNWYAITKYEGEKLVQQSTTQWLIVRIAYPYRAKFEKKDFFRAILDRLQNNKSVEAVVDHIFTPTYVDDIAYALETLIKNSAAGIYHVVGSQSLTPYDAAMIIASEFGFDKDLIHSTTRAEYFLGKAPRPFRLALKNDKIQRLGVPMKTFEEGLIEIKKTLNSNF